MTRYVHRNPREECRSIMLEFGASSIMCRSMLTAHSSLVSAYQLEHGALHEVKQLPHQCNSKLIVLLY